MKGDAPEDRFPGWAPALFAAIACLPSLSVFMLDLGGTVGGSPWTAIYPGLARLLVILLFLGFFPIGIGVGISLVGGSLGLRLKASLLLGTLTNVAGLALVAWSWGTLRPSPDAYREIARRGAPIVESIESYHRRNGFFPTDLSDAIDGTAPQTGLLAYPRFGYTRKGRGYELFVSLWGNSIVYDRQSRVWQTAH
jgi:hypothetical protein